MSYEQTRAPEPNDFLATLGVERLEPIQQQIVQHLVQHQEIATRDCVERFGITDGTARSHLRRLRELGIIEARGSGPKRRYILTGT